MTYPVVAIVDDDKELCSSLVDLMRSVGYRAEAFSTEGRLTRQDSNNQVSTGLEQARSASSSDPLPSLGSNLLNPTVQIAAAEQIKRLGTGWHCWFSESIHVPTGAQIEFRFQAPKHLLEHDRERPCEMSTLLGGALRSTCS